MELPEQVKQARLALGWTHAQLGAALGVNRKVIAQWERGAALPEYPRLLELALRQVQFDNGVLPLDPETEKLVRQGIALMQATNRLLREPL